MSTGEYLEKVTVGKPDRLDGRIALHEYDAGWAELFLGEKAKIENALAGRACAVEHVGSTSVPGLCAKPIIDILLLVPDAAGEAAYVPALEAAGYRLRIREPEWYEHRMLKGQGPEVNLHVFSFGCEEAERMLCFRDRLRTCAADRELYAAEKRRLAANTWGYVQDYADAKTDVIRAIMAHARPREAE